MTQTPETSPIGEAMIWASRVMAIGLTMFLPGVAGNWLDVRLGTGVLGPAGLVIGFSTAIFWLVELGRQSRHRRNDRRTRNRESDQTWRPPDLHGTVPGPEDPRRPPDPTGS